MLYKFGEEKEFFVGGNRFDSVKQSFSNIYFSIYNNNANVYKLSRIYIVLSIFNQFLHV